MVDAPINPYSTKALAILYGVSYKVLKSWLVKIPDLPRQRAKKWTVAEVKIIFTHLGTPEIDEKLFLILCKKTTNK